MVVWHKKCFLESFSEIFPEITSGETKLSKYAPRIASFTLKKLFVDGSQKFLQNHQKENGVFLFEKNKDTRVKNKDMRVKNQKLHHL
jgi:hypothetical protein